MKNLSYIIIILSFFYSCQNITKDRTKTSVIDSNNRNNLKISGSLTNLLQFDSIFETIEIIPLETRKECLITNILKAVCYNDRLYIHDEAGRLLVFNIEGKFLYEVGKQGRGPGEFSYLMDFDLDKGGNIYVLDYRKILKYSYTNSYLKSIPFRFSQELCNPLQFALTNDDRFFIWGGSFAVTENSEGKIFSMYELKNGDIKNRYFPVKYNIAGSFRQFIRYTDLIILDPIFGSNIIYSINNDNVKERYYIDFGEKALKIPVPEGFTSLNDFKIRVDNEYYHSITGFTELSNWIYFKFVYKRKVYNVFFSKQLNKSFLSRQWPLIPGRIAPWNILGTCGDRFMAFIDPKYVIEQINICKQMNQDSLSFDVRDHITKLGLIKITDNPVLFICSTKIY